MKKQFSKSFKWNYLILIIGLVAFPFIVDKWVSQNRQKPTDLPKQQVKQNIPLDAMKFELVDMRRPGKGSSVKVKAFQENQNKFLRRLTNSFQNAMESQEGRQHFYNSARRFGALGTDAQEMVRHSFGRLKGERYGFSRLALLEVASAAKMDPSFISSLGEQEISDGQFNGNIKTLLPSSRRARSMLMTLAMKSYLTEDLPFRMSSVYLGRQLESEKDPVVRNRYLKLFMLRYPEDASAIRRIASGL